MSFQSYSRDKQPILFSLDGIRSVNVLHLNLIVDLYLSVGGQNHPRITTHCGSLELDCIVQHDSCCIVSETVVDK